MKAKICDCCKKTYIPDMGETKKYTHRISSTEGGKLHLLDLCPDCLAKVDAMMDGKAVVVNNDSYIPEVNIVGSITPNGRPPFSDPQDCCCCCETRLPDEVNPATE